MVIDKKIYDNVSEITMTNYEPLVENKDFVLLSVDSIITMLEDLIREVDYREEQIDDLELDIQENYKPISKEEMYLG